MGGGNKLVLKKLYTNPNCEYPSKIPKMTWLMLQVVHKPAEELQWPVEFMIDFVNGALTVSNWISLYLFYATSACTLKFALKFKGLEAD